MTMSPFFQCSFFKENVFLDKLIGFSMFSTPTTIVQRLFQKNVVSNNCCGYLFYLHSFTTGLPGYSNLFCRKSGSVVFLELFSYLQILACNSHFLASRVFRSTDASRRKGFSCTYTHC